MPVKQRRRRATKGEKEPSGTVTRWDASPEPEVILDLKKLSSREREVCTVSKRERANKVDH